MAIHLSKHFTMWCFSACSVKCFYFVLYCKHFQYDMAECFGIKNDINFHLNIIAADDIGFLPVFFQVSVSTPKLRDLRRSLHTSVSAYGQIRNAFLSCFLPVFRGYQWNAAWLIGIDGTMGCRSQTDKLLPDIFDGNTLSKGLKATEAPFESFPQPKDV